MDETSSRKDENEARRLPIFSSIIADISIILSSRNRSREWSLDNSFIPAMASIVSSTVIITLSFGFAIQSSTSSIIGVIETIMATFIGQTLYSMIGSIPIAIVGVTPLQMLFLIATSRAATWLGLPLLPLMSWTGFWTATWLLLIGSTNSSRFLTGKDPSLGFNAAGVMASMAVAYEGISCLTLIFDSQNLDASLVGLWLATGTFSFVMIMSAMGWSYDSWQAVWPFLALVTFTALQGVPYKGSPPVSTLLVPQDISYHTDKATKLLRMDSFTQIQRWAAIAAAFPGLTLTALILLERSFTVHAFRLQFPVNDGLFLSGSWDCVLLAAMALFSSFLGLPFVGFLPDISVVHGRMLRGRKNGPDQPLDEEMNSNDRLPAGYGGRASGFAAALAGAIFFIPGLTHLIELVPQGVMIGQLAQIAVAHLRESRVPAMAARLYGSHAGKGPLPRRHLATYVLIQCILGAVLFGLYLSPLGFTFPIFLLIGQLFGFQICGLLIPEASWKLLIPSPPCGSCEGHPAGNELSSAMSAEQVLLPAQDAAQLAQQPTMPHQQPGTLAGRYATEAVPPQQPATSSPHAADMASQSSASPVLQLERNWNRAYLDSLALPIASPNISPSRSTWGGGTPGALPPTAGSLIGSQKMDENPPAVFQNFPEQLSPVDRAKKEAIPDGSTEVHRFVPSSIRKGKKNKKSRSPLGIRIGYVGRSPAPPVASLVREMRQLASQKLDGQTDHGLDSIPILGSGNILEPLSGGTAGSFPEASPDIRTMEMVSESPVPSDVERFKKLGQKTTVVRKITKTRTRTKSRLNNANIQSAIGKSVRFQMSNVGLSDDDRVKKPSLQFLARKALNEAT